MKWIKYTQRVCERQKPLTKRMDEIVFVSQKIARNSQKSLLWNVYMSISILSSSHSQCLHNCKLPEIDIYRKTNSFQIFVINLSVMLLFPVVLCVVIYLTVLINDARCESIFCRLNLIRIPPLCFGKKTSSPEILICHPFTSFNRCFIWCPNEFLMMLQAHSIQMEITDRRWHLNQIANSIQGK